MNNTCDTVILKCETQKMSTEIPVKSHVWDMLLSVATTYSYNENTYRFWSTSTIDGLKKYLYEKNVVGFNIHNFDLPLLFQSKSDVDANRVLYRYHKNDGNTETYCITSDIFTEIMFEVFHVNELKSLQEKMSKHPLVNGKVFNLLNIYQATINKKCDSSLIVNCCELYKNKKILQLLEVNLRKIVMIKELYDFICQYKYVVNGDYDVCKVPNILTPDTATDKYFILF